MCFGNFLFAPCCNPYIHDAATPHFFQLPVFRLVAAGEAFVALFLVLTGFTASHKALGYARSGAPEKAYSSIAVSSFRRLPRLFFPTTLATLFSWAVCNFGGYEISRRADAWWLMALTPTMSFGTAWYQVFLDVWWAIWVPWMPLVAIFISSLGYVEANLCLYLNSYGVNPYDQPQWALQYFVEAVNTWDFARPET